MLLFRLYKYSIKLRLSVRKMVSVPKVACMATNHRRFYNKVFFSKCPRLFENENKVLELSARESVQKHEQLLLWRAVKCVTTVPEGLLVRQEVKTKSHPVREGFNCVNISCINGWSTYHASFISPPTAPFLHSSRLLLTQVTVAIWGGIKSTTLQ